MEQDKLKQIIEAAILAAGRPLSLDAMQGLFPEEGRPDKAALREALAALAEECSGRGVELKEVASGFRFQVRQELEPWVSRLWEERPQRYSRALLETLALIAYRQPITRGEIEEIRGVSVSSNIVKTLLEREWVRVVGHRDVPGRPAMYGTTREFLDYFNLKGLDELPALSELRDIDSINAELDLALPGEGRPAIAEGEPPAAAEGEEDAAADQVEEEAEVFPEPLVASVAPAEPSEDENAGAADTDGDVPADDSQRGNV